MTRLISDAQQSFLSPTRQFLDAFSLDMQRPQHNEELDHGWSDGPNAPLAHTVGRHQSVSDFQDPSKETMVSCCERVVNS